VPVEFLRDAEAAAYGCFNGPPSREELERVFFLDDADRALVDRRRGVHNRLGFALQLTTVRSLGLFLADPLDVPQAVVDYLGGQLVIADPSCVARYTERRSTRFEHADENFVPARDWAADPDGRTGEALLAPAGVLLQGAARHAMSVPLGEPLPSTGATCGRRTRSSRASRPSGCARR